MPEQHRTALRYAGYRLLIGLGVLAATLVYSALGGVAVQELWPYFEVAAVTFGFFLLQLIWFRNLGASNRFLWVQVCLDVALVSALIGLTGGLTSLAAFLYFPTIVAAPFLLPGASALWTAGICTLGCLGAAYLGGTGNPLVLVYEVVLRVLAFFLVGMIMDSYVRRYRQLQQEHSTVLDRLRAGVVSTDKNRIIRSLNPAAEVMLGEVLGQPIQQVLSHIQDAPTWEEHREKAVYVCSQAQLPDGLVVVLDDVTELYRTRERADRDERLVAVGRLAASVAHEIRNPLASLSGCLQMIVEDRNDRIAALALEDVGRLNRLVEDFLQTARAPVLRPINTQLDKLVQEVGESFAQGPQAQQVAEVFLNTIPVQMAVDPDRLRQVLWNLLSNAAQAMPDGGRIEVELRPVPHLEGVQEGVELRIRDEGIGIPPADLPRIFDPFFTTRSGGTGLGLALVDQIIRGHGGHITASRRPERGMEFHIWLPKEP
jgi:two-component system sensor histidine kinase PilS (NtrC family)